MNGQRGVYVKYGDLQRFRRITILYEDDTYILVPEGGKVGEDNELRLYDEVIVERQQPAGTASCCKDRKRAFCPTFCYICN